MITEDFLNKLKMLKIGVKTSAKQMDCVIFDEGEMYTNNGVSGASYYSSELPKGLKGAVEYKVFLSFVTKVKSETFDIECISPDILTIQYGEDKSVDFNLEPIMVNKVPEPANNSWIELPFDFNDGLDTILFCTGLSNDDPRLNHILVTKTHLVATNNLCFGRYNLDSSMSSMDFVPFMLDKAFTKELVKMNPSHYYFDGLRVSFMNESNGMLMVTNNPDYFKFLPVEEQIFSRTQECNVQVPFNRPQMLGVIDRIATIVSSEHKMEQLITIRTKVDGDESGTIELLANSSAGTIHEIIESKDVQSNYEFKVHPVLFKNAIETCSHLMVGPYFCHLSNESFECMISVE